MNEDINADNISREALIEFIYNHPEIRTAFEAAQEEQNLVDDLRNKQNELDKTDDDIDLLEDKLNTARNRKDNLIGDIVVIKSKLEDVHKKWIALNPAKPAPYKKPVIIARQPPKQLKRNIVKEAFDLIWDMMCVNGLAGDTDYALTFKRFDNLIHNRRKTANVFGASWDIWDVYNHLINIDDESRKLADELCAFYGKCVDENYIKKLNRD